MLMRVITSVVGLPILVALVVIGGLPLKLAVLALALTGMHELFRAMSKKVTTLHFVAYLFATVYILLLDVVPRLPFSMLTSIYILTILTGLVLFHKNITVIDAAITVFGLLYVAFLISYVYLVRDYERGKLFVWLIFISSWGCDTGAYIVGKALGKHKLIPSLSPNKTMEGAIGGVIFAGLLASVYGFILSRLFVLGDIRIILFCSIIGVVGGVFSQFGDLTASAIKRYTGIKDYGRIFPGHGGVLDRFDSVLFTAPIVYYVMVALFAYL